MRAAAWLGNKIGTFPVLPEKRVTSTQAAIQIGPNVFNCINRACLVAFGLFWECGSSALKKPGRSGACLPSTRRMAKTGPHAKNAKKRKKRAGFTGMIRMSLSESANPIDHQELPYWFFSNHQWRSLRRTHQRPSSLSPSLSLS